MIVYQKSIKTPVGRLYLTNSGNKLSGAYWNNPNKPPTNSNTSEEVHQLFSKTEKELSDYFLKKRKVFTIPLELEGTVFQKQVWAELLNIAYGEVLSYSDVCKKIGRPNAVRALGTANSKNPVSIIVPCHRVIRSDGQLSGYAGGVDTKKLLLDLESLI
ncbi:MAG: methylated-DNA--[protein]-cysteine S-methyltransferase [Bdellovibrionales bacterium]